MTIRIANAPVSWGIYEFEGLEQQFTYAQVLDQITEAGYTGIELGPWGFLPTDPHALREELDKRSLKLLSSFVPVNLVDRDAHEAGEQHALQVGRLLAALDAPFIVLADDNGKVPELVQQAGQRTGSKLSAEEWDAFAEGVNRIARRISDELGLRIVFHHHCAGYVETPEEVRQLMARADQDLVGLCLDTGHWHYGGGDAVDCIREFGERVRYLHFKDCSREIAERSRQEGLDYFQATAAGVFCELGDGEVDFPSVIAEMEGLGYDGWAIVEQDVLTNDLEAPRRSAQRNRDYLRGLGL